jgi:hypothetical protein
MALIRTLCVVKWLLDFCDTTQKLRISRDDWKKFLGDERRCFREGERRGGKIGKEIKTWKYKKYILHPQILIIEKIP